VQRSLRAPFPRPNARKDRHAKGCSLTQPRRRGATSLGYRAAMTTTPQEPAPDPEVVPSGDPNPIPTEPLPEQPGEDPGALPDEPEIEPPADPRP